MFVKTQKNKQTQDNTKQKKNSKIFFKLVLTKSLQKKTQKCETKIKKAFLQP